MTLLSRFCLTILSVYLLQACAQLPPKSAQVSELGRVPTNLKATEEQRWHQICFRMPMNEEGEPNFSTDLFLAHQVVQPELEQHASEIALWRFHRRAANDQTGHQFGFFYFTYDSVAKQITQAIQESDRLEALRGLGREVGIVVDCWSKAGMESIEGLSDKNWNNATQKAWPYFAMGMSASWLSLIDQLSGEQEHSDNLIAHYEVVESAVIEIWQLQGQHAYIHHLNAIFGYEPVFIRQWMRF